MAPDSAVDINLLEATAYELQSLLSAKKVTSSQLTDMYREQIKKYDGHLHGLISLAPPDIVAVRARQLDDERRDGKLRSKLHGIPIIIKDNIATAPKLGMRTTAGNLALAESQVLKNAHVVDLLMDAGLVIIGKASLSELSNYKGKDMPGGWSAAGGQTQSAYMKDGLKDEDAMYGHSCTSGSSSGSATCVSAGYAPFSLGSETSGSLVSPANRAALYTIRTFAIVAQDGVVPISPTLDVVGPMAKCAQDLVDLFDVIIDSTTPSKSNLQASLVRTFDDLAIATLDPAKWIEFPEKCPRDDDISQQLEIDLRNAFSRIKPLARVFRENVHLAPRSNHFINDKSSTMALMNAEFRDAINAYLTQLEHSPVRSLKELIAWNKSHSDLEMPAGKGDQSLLERANDYEGDNTETERIRRFMREKAATEGLDLLFAEHQVDALLGPGDSNLADYAAAAGYPIAAMPLSQFRKNGRPFGAVAIAKPGDEISLIKVMSAWEATFPPRVMPDMDALPAGRLMD